MSVEASVEGDVVYVTQWAPTRGVIVVRDPRIIAGVVVFTHEGEQFYVRPGFWTRDRTEALVLARARQLEWLRAREREVAKDGPGKGRGSRLRKALDARRVPVPFVEASPAPKPRPERRRKGESPPEGGA